jgi:hypothetical protein
MDVATLTNLSVFVFVTVSFHTLNELSYKIVWWESHRGIEFLTGSLQRGTRTRLTVCFTETQYNTDSTAFDATPATFSTTSYVQVCVLLTTQGDNS